MPTGIVSAHDRIHHALAEGLEIANRGLADQSIKAADYGTIIESVAALYGMIIEKSDTRPFEPFDPPPLRRKKKARA